MLGDNIKNFRENLKISQRELGRRINKTGQFISLIEQGKSNPSIDALGEISNVLGVDVSKLLGVETADEIPRDNPQSYFLEQYLNTLGYEILGDESEGYLILKSKDGEFEITEKDIDDIKNSARSFIEYKLQEITKKSRKIGK